MDYPEEDTTCWCTGSRTPDEWVSCDLPTICESNEQCALQALRYGVVGSIAWGSYGLKEGADLRLDILGAGQARLVSQEYAHDCCGGGSVGDYADYSQVVDVIAPEAEVWASCVADASTDRYEWFSDCLRLDVFSAACTGMHLTECPAVPEPPDPDAPCEESCPMADDGTCDEPTGTGLCFEGCDPVDCAS